MDSIKTWLSQVRKGWSIQLLAAAVCLSIVLGRMFKPDLKFDSLSLYLVLIAVASATLPNVAAFVSRVKHLKIGAAEILMADIESLGERLEAVAEAKVPATEGTPTVADSRDQADDIASEAVIEPGDKFAGRYESESASESDKDTPSVQRHRHGYSKLSLLGKRMSLLSTFIYVAEELRKEIIARYNKRLPAGGRRLSDRESPLQAVRHMVRTRTIDDDVAEMFREYWRMRNEVAHGVVDPGDKELRRLIDIGSRLRVAIAHDPDDGKEEPVS